MDRNSQFFPPIAKLTDANPPKLAWNASTLKEHRAWRRKFRPKLKELLGHMPQSAPLKVDWDQKVEKKRFTRHKVYIQSEQDYWIPAYYFVPKALKQKAPAIVCLHGHSGIVPYIREGNRAQRTMAKELAVDYAPYLAEQGYVTLALVQRAWNETIEGLKLFAGVNGCYRFTMDCFLTGRTPVGIRVWDSMRAVDFLETRPEVDASRIGAVGLSGGGTTTLFFSALEPRVKLAMIAGYFCTFRDSIFSIYHCICNCVPKVMEWGEMSDVGALIAPRPALIISGDKDPIFPIGPTRRAYRELRKTYKLLGAEQDLESDFFDGPHAWSNRKSVPFLKKHFG